MSTEAQNFTHLESLLLFQSVAAYGNTADSFARISNALKSSELLQRSAGADSDRLNPQALTDLYLRLLKSEAKLSLQSSEKSSAQDAKKTEAATPSRRSEIPSPKIATLEDADQHRHLEPQMIDRLYGLYKDQVIQEISEEEQKYDDLVGQAKSLEIELKQEDVDEATEQDVVNAETSATGLAVNQNRHDSDTDDPHVAKDEKGLEIGVKHSTAVEAVRNRREPDGGESPAAVQSSPKRGKTPTQQRVIESVKPPTPATLDVPAQPNTSDIPKETRSASVSPRKKQLRQAQGSSELSTPDTSTDNDVQVNIQEPDDPATNHQFPRHEELQPNHLQPQPAKHTPHSPSGQQPSSLATRSGGMQLPPFQVSPQAPHHSQQPQTAKQVLSQPLPRQVKSAQELQNQSTPAGNAAALNLNTPNSSAKQASSSRESQVKAGQGTFTTPGSDTKWKVMPGMADVPLPRPRSISPLSDEPVSPVPSEKQTPSRHHKSATAGPVRDVRETRRSKATRAGSKTPSVALSTQARTRSQSIASNADDGSLQSAPGTVKDPRHDASTTTADTQPSARQRRATRNSTAAPATTAATTGKRKRAPTLETDTAATPGSNSIPPSPTPGIPSARRATFDKEIASTITASRNFHKTSAPMLNNIGSHRHASLFAGPVSSRTAGYYDIIKRPTDLSTIRKAIAAGVKAVNSGVAAASPSAATPVTFGADAGGTVTLPVSRELVPPEGIVNGAQLEQEVMRMFANAVMFNEGDDGVVADTREMFEDTEKTIAAWKAAETGKELGEDAAGGAGDEGSIGTSAKRRRA